MRRRPWWALAANVGSVLVVISSYLASSPPHGQSLWLIGAGLIGCWVVAALVTLPVAPRLGETISMGVLATSVALSAAREALVHDHGRHGTAQAVAIVAACAAMALIVHVVLSLPDGRLEGRPRLVAAAFSYTAALGLGAYLATTSRLWPPLALWLGWTAALAMIAPGVCSRYRRAPAASRQRLQCLSAGAAAAFIVALLALTLHLLVAWPHQVKDATLIVTVMVPLGLVAAATPFTSRADRLLVILLRACGLAVVVSGVYLIALRVLTRPPTTSESRNVLWWSLSAAGVASVVALGFERRFDRLATSFTYGAREAPDEVVRTFGTRLTRAIPMDELLLQLAESLRKTLTLSSAEIYTGTGEQLELAASVPDVGQRTLRVSGDERAVIARAGVSGNAWAAVWIPSLTTRHGTGPLRVAPISHAGELLGVIAVYRVEGAVAFREEDDRVLTELARQVGLAIHNAQLDSALQSSLDELRHQADELRASRARVVASGDAERRRVERNLHDGAQQHLVALAINLRLAKDIVSDDPEAAIEMLDELGRSVQDTIKELRELAHGIYPPLLVDSGLTEALKAVANRSPLDVELVTDGIERYGRDLEAAIYFCCLEALQNAGKHAPDAHVVIRVWEESGGLLFEVTDDGPGFDVTTAKSGHGYVNMMDRLGAIGGAVRWESAPGRGTTIRGSVPLN